MPLPLMPGNFTVQTSAGDEGGGAPAGIEDAPEQAAGQDEDDANGSVTFSDVPTNHLANQNIAAAQSAGVIFGGITGNRFKAGANATRAESASSIVEMLQLP